MDRHSTGHRWAVTRRAFLAGSGAAVISWGCGTGTPEDVDGDLEEEEDEDVPLEDEEGEPLEEPVPVDDDITGAEGPVDAVLVDADIPAGAAIFGWVNELVDLGIRRPGYEGAGEAEEWLESHLEALGLEDVRREAVTVTRWEPVEQSLRVQVGDDEPVELDCYPMAHSPELARAEFDLVLSDSGDPEGAAVLQQVRLHDSAADAVLHQGSVPLDVAGRLVDPDGSLAGERQILPLGLGSDDGYVDRAAGDGAGLVIGWIDGDPDDTHEVYGPDGDEELPVPGLWVSGSDGAWLRRQLATEGVRVTARIRATSRRTSVYNVVGELPGADEQKVMITSHHDGPWASAVEGASGVALVLAQARYWAAQPVERRPHRLVFLLHAGQVAGGVGARRVISGPGGSLDDVVLQVGLENAGLVVEGRGDSGEPVVRDRAVPRWFFTSRVARLETAVLDALHAEEVDRSLLLAPDALGDRPPTGAARYHDEGVPLVHFAPAPSYIRNNTDTLDRVDQEGLAPLTRVMVRVVASTAGVSAGMLRVGRSALR